MVFRESTADPGAAHMDVIRGTSAQVAEAVDGGPADVEQLWKDARAAGGPLVEPAGDGRSAVTFLWRGDADRVTLVGLCDYDDLSRTDLTRIAGTEVWHLTLLLPSDTKASYAFLRNAAGNDAQSADWLPDSTNPHTYRFACNRDGIDPDPDEHDRSSLYLAPRSRWSVADPAVPAGTVTMHWLRAADTHLTRDHRIWVYEPANAGTGAHPVAVMFDGDCYVAPMLSMPTSLDNLIAAGRIPPTYALLIESLDNRGVELNGDPDFLAFLTDDLLPWASDRYPITDDPGRTLVGGSSMGGVCAGYAALRSPDRFGLVLSQSGAFQRTSPTNPAGSIARYEEAPRLPLRWYLDVGTFETHTDPFDGGTLLGSNHRFRDVLAAKGYPFRYAEFAGGHDYLCWRDTLPDGLIELLGR